MKEDSEYQGVQKNRFEGYLGPGEGTGARLDPEASSISG